MFTFLQLILRSVCVRPVLKRLLSVAPTFDSTHTRPVRQYGSLRVHLCSGPGQSAADAKINVASSGASAMRPHVGGDLGLRRH